MVWLLLWMRPPLVNIFQQAFWSSVTYPERRQITPLWFWWTVDHSGSSPSFPSFSCLISAIFQSVCENPITLPSFNFSPVSPPALAELLELQETGQISSSVAKQVSQPHRQRNYPLLPVTRARACLRSSCHSHLSHGSDSGVPGDVEVTR